ncbi:efflux RND transporter periplasmic adaptor subunit [aff. Roholtiella sp. LEGE 12411]|uniref:efflux RND transporter periplasmic adaptor subunit n=1 Tax=aff. Roholtiella sp. LEGE 12411 TaxID=1828822 RepID=UPI00188164E6|nr:efflux RND transporter periplasmic adaptor subunit [aff. Roholtiella sp. LEGE 12411]MBE9034903.1 efflux RND transporter periplasmic adaptor subunit [aff. Roholtiella sp. LEGE 12411]
MHSPERSQAFMMLRCVSGGFLSLILVTMSVPVLAGGGHSHGEPAFNTEAGQAAGKVQIDAKTAQRLNIKVEPVTRQRLAISIKTTGQIENLPSKQVEVTTPISGAKVVELLVEPGVFVKAGQPVAVLSSPDLVELRVNSQEKRAEAQGDLQQAQADLKLAQQNYQRYSQIAAAEIAQAQSQVAYAQEKYSKDQQLADAGALARRNALESETQLAQAKAQLTTAASRRDVIQAEAQLKRAQSSVQVAQSRLQLSNTTYETRLQQLGTRANAKGLVTMTAPISGRIANREVTLGQTFQDAGGKLMTIVNDRRVFATANIYEKDLNLVRQNQQVRVKATGTNRTFTGKIAVIGSVVQGETRVVPVKAEVDNSSSQLKPGMFAQLEVLTDQTTKSLLAIPSDAVVEANGKNIVFVQNGDGYEAVEVTLGKTSGDMVEVENGLFDGDRIVTNNAVLVYGQSLRTPNKALLDEHTDEDQVNNSISLPNGMSLPLLLGLGASGVLAIAAAAYWAGRRTQRNLVPAIEGFIYDHKSDHSSLNHNNHLLESEFKKSDSIEVHEDNSHKN